jgi:DNA-binding response OmpR family regulator
VKRAECLQAGNLSLHPESAEMKNVESGRTMQITGKELHLLEMFLRNPNQVLEKEQIATKVWGYESEAEYNNVEVYVSFLRKKMKHLDVNVRIRSVRGVGYTMEVQNG